MAEYRERFPGEITVGSVKAVFLSDEEQKKVIDELGPDDKTVFDIVMGHIAERANVEAKLRESRADAVYLRSRAAEDTFLFLNEQMRAFLAKHDRPWWRRLLGR